MSSSMLKFRRDERGQALVFAAFTFFALMVMGLMVLGVSEATTTQMKLQNSADAAVYSAALVEADALAQIAWMNAGMAQMYYRSLRIAQETAAFAVYDELENIQGVYDPAVTLAGIAGIPALQPDAATVGITGANSKYTQAYQLASDIIPKAEAWMTRLSKLQRGIAALAPALAEHQVYYTAKENGSERTAMYRRFTFLPDGPQKQTVDIEKNGTYSPDMSSGAYPVDRAYTPWPDPDGIGWHLYSTTNSFDMVATHFVHHAPSLYSDDDAGNAAWEAIAASPFDFPEPTDVPSVAAKKVHDLWKVDLVEGKYSATITVGAKYPKKGESQPAYYWFHLLSSDGSDDEVFVEVTPDGGVRTIGESGEVTLTPTEEGVDIEYDDGRKISARYNDAGFLQQWTDDDGDGEKDADEWYNVDGDNSKTIDGIEVPIEDGIDIDLGKLGNLPIKTRITQPIRLDIGRLHILLTNPMIINYSTNAGWVHVEDEEATINGLSTKTADGLWKDFTWDDWKLPGSGSDRTMHRMSVVTADEHWLYEWVRVGSFLEEMPMRKLAAHMMMDADESYQQIKTLEPERFYDVPDENDDKLWQDFGKDSDSLWKYYPAWARPARTPVAADGDGDLREFGGIMDLATGAPTKVSGSGLPPFGAAFSQTRECWFCGTVGGTGKINDWWGLDAGDSALLGPKYVRPAGFFILESGTYGAALLETIDKRFNKIGKDTGKYWAWAVRNKDGDIVRLQVKCPLRCKRSFTAAPTYDTDAQAKIEPEKVKTMVRVYLAHAFEKQLRGGASYDYTKDVSQMVMDADKTQRDFYRIEMDFNDPNMYQKPLQLTSQFFKDALTVAVWDSPAGDTLMGEFGGKNPSKKEKDLGINNSLDNSMDRGLYGLGAAKPVLPYTDDAGATVLMPEFKWQDPAGGVAMDEAMFVGAGEDPLDIIGFQKNWARQQYLKSGRNMFNPGWTAALIAIRKAADPRDVYTAEDLAKLKDNGARFLLEKIRGAGWRKDILNSGNGNRNVDNSANGPRQGWFRMKAPPIQKSGGNVDYNSPDIEKVIRH